MKLNIITTILFIAALFGPSCKKEEGEGGTSKITGKVIEEKWDNTYSLLLNTYPAQIGRAHV